MMRDSKEGKIQSNGPQNLEDLLRMTRDLHKMIQESAEGLIDEKTLEQSNLVPARLRESYIHYRTYLIKTIMTSSKQERLNAIRFQVYGLMRQAGYSYIFQDKRKMMEIDKFIDSFFSGTAEDLAALKIHQLDNLFLLQGKREQESKAETWRQEHTIRFGPIEKEMPHL